MLIEYVTEVRGRSDISDRLRPSCCDYVSILISCDTDRNGSCVDWSGIRHNGSSQIYISNVERIVKNETERAHLQIVVNMVILVADCSPYLPDQSSNVNCRPSKYSGKRSKTHSFETFTHSQIVPSSNIF